MIDDDGEGRDAAQAIEQEEAMLRSLRRFRGSCGL